MAAVRIQSSESRPRETVTLSGHSAAGITAIIMIPTQAHAEAAMCGGPGPTRNGPHCAQV